MKYILHSRQGHIKLPKRILFLWAVCLGLAICLSWKSGWSQANNKISISGFVKDTSGNVVVGVVIADQDHPNIATYTDNNGQYILDIAPGTVLVTHYLGYVDQKVVVDKSSKVINFTIRPENTKLNEVVVTAFGRKQRKEAVVGSVTSVNPGELKIPSSNLTNALAGKVAGLIGFQRGGQPGADNSSFFIRGVTTLGYSASPLILVDNIELSPDDLARLQPDDIESFSILKDASAAALYGARGANGVILITTKEGKLGKAKVNVRMETSISQPTKSVRLADPITYMKDYNEAVTTRNPLATPFFTPNQILSTQATLDHAPGSNPYVYPAVDWMSTLFKNRQLRKEPILM